MIVWEEPKTNWQKTDKFNISDYNRIRRNILFIQKRLAEINMYFELLPMGEDMEDYTGYWSAEIFNAIEKNVSYLNSRIENKDIGDTKTFYPNGIFITYDEVNRLESAILDMKTAIDNIEKGIRHIPFRLGSYDALRI